MPPKTGRIALCIALMIGLTRAALRVVVIIIDSEGHKCCTSSLDCMSIMDQRIEFGLSPVLF